MQPHITCIPIIIITYLDRVIWDIIIDSFKTYLILVFLETGLKNENLFQIQIVSAVFARDTLPELVLYRLPLW